MELKTLRDIVDQSAALYGTAPAYRYKVKKAVEDKSFLDVKNDTMAMGRMIEHLGLSGKHIAVLGPTSYPWIISFFGITGSASVAAVLWTEGKLPGGVLTVKNPGGDLTVTITGAEGKVTELLLEGPTEVVTLVEM